MFPYISFVVQVMITPTIERREASKSGGDDKPPVKPGSNADKPKPPQHRYALEIMDFLQTYVEPASFNPRGAYDGQSNLFLWRPKIGAGRTVRQFAYLYFGSILM